MKNFKEGDKVKGSYHGVHFTGTVVSYPMSRYSGDYLVKVDVPFVLFSELRTELVVGNGGGWANMAPQNDCFLEAVA